MKKLILLLGTLVIVFRLNAQETRFAHILYAEAMGPAYYNYFEKKGYWSVNYKFIPIGNGQTSKPFLRAGYGFCKSNLSNSLHYFPLQLGLNFGKDVIFGNVGIAGTMVFGNDSYERTTIWGGTRMEERSFLAFYTGSVGVDVLTASGVYVHGGFNFRFMPNQYSDFGAGGDQNGLSFEIGAGYTFFK